MYEYRHHSRNDQWIAEVVFPGLRGGFFVEAGACGGIQQSSTYVLEHELGWTGVCVEPFDDYYDLLRQRRTCATDPRCLSGRTGDRVEFLTYFEQPARSGIRVTNKNEGSDRTRGMTTTTTTKETVSLSDLLEQHHAPSTVEYLGLDVEGAELSVLEAFDFARDRTILALSIEGRQCDALLKSYGYAEVTNPHGMGIPDKYFVHRRLQDRLREHLVASA